ncbi:hypothetical protein JKP88DRAFT_304753 [Tribonema minus]|uniref:Uncharacterized protein n=1 Tax=Tribonema minus TaxID=303371 RepID=A0A836CK32_9STRA|nr:hypothetical protein JKP88DRAFT_304753 [Tribonema minus]
MLLSSSFWAQADALSCLGWLAGANTTPPPAPQDNPLAPLAPLVITLLAVHLAKTARAEGANVEAAVLERDDNLRVYALAFLLKLHAARPELLPRWCAAAAAAVAPQAGGAEAGGGSGLAAVLLPLACAARGRGAALPLALRLLHLMAVSAEGRGALLAERCVPVLARLRQELQRDEASAASAAAAAAARPRTSAAGGARGYSGGGASSGNGPEELAEGDDDAAGDEQLLAEAGGAGPQSEVVSAILEAVLQRPCG